MGSFCLRDRESQVVMRASDCGWLQIMLAQAQRSQHLLCKPLTPHHQGARIRRKKDLSAVVHSICLAGLSHSATAVCSECESAHSESKASHVAEGPFLLWSGLGHCQGMEELFLFLCLAVTQGFCMFC